MNRMFFIIFCLFSTSGIVAQTYQEQLKAIHSNVVEQKDGKSYYIHKVKKGQTLYMISKSYGVEVNDIIEENPVVKEGLKADQTLRIPFPGQKKEAPAKKPEPGIPHPASRIPQPASDSLSSTTSVIPCGSDTSTRNKTYKVVLMLPLYLEEVEAMNPETATDEALDNWNSLKFLPFYEGFKLAIDSLQNQGLHLTLYVYDLGKDTLKTTKLLKKPEVRSADLIIGLLYQRNFEIVAKFAHERKIPIINPLSERSEIIRDNEMVFKTYPSGTSRLDCLADFMQKNMYRGQIIIIRNGQFKDKDIADRLNKECRDRKLDVFLAEGQDVAIGKLSKSKENVVVAFTDNNVYALDLMRRFYELRNDYTLSLIGLPEWGTIERLDIDFLNGLNTRMVAPFFVDYSDAGVKKFVGRFQAQFKTDPETLAFQGFDVGYYFLTALMRYGKRFPACISEFSLRTAQTSFEFTRPGNNQNNGFENRHWSVYKYENFKLVREN